MSAAPPTGIAQTSVALTVEGLTKRFGSALAVDNISFHVSRGASLGIVGESGSGKTTVARMLVALEVPTSGTIRFHAAVPDTAKPRLVRARQVQMVFQDPYLSLDPRLCGREAVDRVLRLHFSYGAAERAKRIADLFDNVGLSTRETSALPRALSGGQRQRLAIARALAVEPAVLVLDEATSALDVSVQAQILTLLRDIRSSGTISMVFISHDLAVINEITDAIAVMYQGRIVESGRTRDVLAEPKDPYTALLLDSLPTRGWDPAAVAERRRRMLADTVETP